MMQEDVKYIRKTIQLEPELSNTIEGMAERNNWSFSYMCSVLLQQAVKEKLRKKKGAKENNT